MSFNTAYFCGEWFKGAIKRGKGYAELLTLDTFRPRYLSTPWGVPNFFLPITSERKQEVSSETECILAYLLPHGVPLYPKYLNAAVARTVVGAMVDFGARTAAFTPCWKRNDLLPLDAGGDRNVLLATWRRGGDVLAVVSNLGEAETTATLTWRGEEPVQVAQLFPPATDSASRTVRPQQNFAVAVPPHTFRLLRCRAAAGPPAALATRTEGAPKINGRLDEPAWETAPELTGFVLTGSMQPASQQTSARILFDDEALYFGFTCSEDNMDKLVAADAGRDPQPLTDDCVHVLLGPTHDRFNFLQFAVSASGARFDASGDGVGVAADWDAPWQAAVARGKDRWTAELAIPFACLQLNDKVGSIWDLNLCRQERPHAERSAWAPTGDRFAAPHTFGTLSGLDADFAPHHVSAGLAKPLAGGAGRNTAVLRIANLGKTQRRLRCELRIKPPSEKPRTIKSATETFAPGAPRKVKLAYQIFEPGPHELAFSVFDAETERRAAAFERNVDTSVAIEHLLFHSYYRDDVTVRSHLNVGDEALAACRLTATLKAADDDRVLVRRSLTPQSRTMSVALPLNGAKPGQYRIEMALKTGDGPERTETLRFTVLRDRPVDELEVHPRADLTLVVRGEPFFPIGVYEAPSTQRMMAELKSAGFNTVRCPHSGSPRGTKMVLDRIHEAGLKAWVVLGHGLDLSHRQEAREKMLRDMAATVSRHPALLVWESIDEPAWVSQNADGLAQGYEFLRRIEPHHPVWMNHAPRNLISTLAYFNRGADIAGADIYPVPEPQAQSNLPNKTISVVGDEADKNRSAVNDEKPIFMVLQAFAWRMLWRADDPEAVHPTFAQQRYMAYNAILHGARGILYWGAQYTPKPSAAWAAVKTIVSELSRMHAVLVAPPGGGDLRVASDTDSVEGVLRRVGNELYLICVNNVDREAEVTVSGLPADAGSLRVLFEPGRSCEVRNGELSLHMPGYGVVVATTDSEFDDSRPDYSEELRRAPRIPSVDEMCEPGNAAPNPSFEFDVTGTGLPDLWSCRHPFSAAIDTVRPRSGERCLKFVTPVADSRPLLVLNRISVEPNREYELSVWLRSDGGPIEGRIYAEWVQAGKFHSKVAPWTRGTDAWQRITHRFRTTPPPGNRLYIVVQIQGKGAAWFDDVKLELLPE